jgi:hypothetical protein
LLQSNQRQKKKDKIIAIVAALPVQPVQPVQPARPARRRRGAKDPQSTLRNIISGYHPAGIFYRVGMIISPKKILTDDNQGLYQFRVIILFIV